LSPSLRAEVKGYIFRNAIIENKIFKEDQEIINFLVNDITISLFKPEEMIINQEDEGCQLYFITKG